MMDIKNILLISTDDTSRGVMAEAVLNRLFLERGITDMKLCSRGLVVLFPEPVNSKTATVLENNGISCSEYRSIQVRPEDFQGCDLVITMSREEKNKVLEEYEALSLVYTLKELAGEQGEMLDPYGKDLIDYEYCYREIERLAEKSLKNIVEGVEE